MKEKINQINQSIDEKRNRLMEKAERYFASIIIPSNITLQQRDVTANSGKVPPIAYILYGIAGLSAVGLAIILYYTCILYTCNKELSATLDKQEKIGDEVVGDWLLLFDNSGLISLFLLGVAVASAIGGYKLSKRTNISKDKVSSYSQNVNIDSLKNEVSTKVLDSVKKITQEWEEFMELKQRELQSAISTSSIDDEEKESMLSKTNIYEIIDIRISEFLSMINSVSNPSDIKNQLDLYKSKLIFAIDSAAKRQISKYNLLCI